MQSLIWRLRRMGMSDPSMYSKLHSSSYRPWLFWGLTSRSSSSLLYDGREWRERKLSTIDGHRPSCRAVVYTVCGPFLGRPPPPLPFSSGAGTQIGRCSLSSLLLFPVGSLSLSLLGLVSSAASLLFALRLRREKEKEGKRFFFSFWSSVGNFFFCAAPFCHLLPHPKGDVKKRLLAAISCCYYCSLHKYLAGASILGVSRVFFFGKTLYNLDGLSVSKLNGPPRPNGLGYPVTFWNTSEKIRKKAISGLSNFFLAPESCWRVLGEVGSAKSVDLSFVTGGDSSARRAERRRRRRLEKSPWVEGQEGNAEISVLS